MGAELNAIVRRQWVVVKLMQKNMASLVLDVAEKATYRFHQRLHALHAIGSELHSLDQAMEHLAEMYCIEFQQSFDQQVLALLRTMYDEIRTLCSAHVLDALNAYALHDPTCHLLKKHFRQSVNVAPENTGGVLQKLFRRFAPHSSAAATPKPDEAQIYAKIRHAHVPEVLQGYHNAAHGLIAQVLDGYAQSLHALTLPATQA